jgi:hypothetical protein
MLVVSMACTTPPKEDKVDTSSVEAPMAQALVAQPRSKAPDDNLSDADLSLLNFNTAESEIICQIRSWLWRCWPNSGKLVCPVSYSGWSGFHDP